jgi:GNAT superfamily N-acetyltransferase
MACGASDGRVDDLGAFRTTAFLDPDGMRVELTLIIDDALRHIQAPEPMVPAQPDAVLIERLSDSTCWPEIDAMLREYVPWAAERLEVEHGIRFDDINAEMEKHHASFASDMENILSGRGRLLLARLHGKAVGLVALKPIDDAVAEVKRLYVSQSARGNALGRALMHRLIAEARGEAFQTLRLETMTFMREARAIYASFGFRDVLAFKGTQPTSGLEGALRYMELQLRD